MTPATLTHPTFPSMKTMSSPLMQEFAWMIDQCRTRRKRSLLEFAEQEIILPDDGPFAGLRFSTARQPLVKLIYTEMTKSHKYTYVSATGPSQSGKTLAFFVIPILWMLFELGETVVVGLPDLKMASEKWTKDLLPIIRASKYRHMLPTKGDGSRDGKSVDEIIFKNGKRLKFMGAGGGDKQRAAYTTRNVVITETDGFDEQGKDSNSRESDKISQIEARTNANQLAGRRIWMECTVTVPKGRTWQNHLNGTQCRIVCPCPGCNALVSPEREHLRGWREAENVLDAIDNAYFVCPACDRPILDNERIAMNRAARLVYRGQEVTPDGRIVGTPCRTDMFSFRWSGFNNLFANAGTLAAEEWRAVRADDKQNAEKRLNQFVWAVPYTPPDLRTMPLSQHAIVRRTLNLARGVVPSDYECLAAHFDLGQTKSWWMVVAGRPGFGVHIVDHGMIEVDSERLGVEKALLQAMDDYKKRMAEGFMVEGSQRVNAETGEFKATVVMPDHCWVDGGWQGNRDQKSEAYVTYKFCAESNKTDAAYDGRWRPTFGRGSGQNMRSYSRPTTNPMIKQFEEYHLHYTQVNTGGKTEGMWLVEANADHWKTFAHARLAMPMPEPAKEGDPSPSYAGVATLFHGTPEEHRQLAEHLLAESHLVDENGKAKWVREHRMNHKFDNFYNCCMALHFGGCRLFDGDVQPPSHTPVAPTTPTAFATPDGRAFVASQRKD